MVTVLTYSKERALVTEPTPSLDSTTIKNIAAQNTMGVDAGKHGNTRHLFRLCYRC